jgi:hypothetical protein
MEVCVELYKLISVVSGVQPWLAGGRRWGRDGLGTTRKRKIAPRIHGHPFFSLVFILISSYYFYFNNISQ